MRNPSLVRLCRNLVLITACAIGGSAVGSSLGSSSSEKAKLTALGKDLPTAKLMWVRGAESGPGRIYYSPVKGLKPQVLTPSGKEENDPRWSPDGTKMLFTRTGKGVMTMEVDIHATDVAAVFKRNTEKLVLAGAHTASWTRDGKSITAIAANDYELLKYDLASNTKKTIYDPRDAKWAGEDGYMQKIAQAAELRTGGSRFLLTFRRYKYSGKPASPQGADDHVTEVVDLQQTKVYTNAGMRRGDCSPAWAPNGSYLLTTARLTSRPALKANFSPSGSPPVKASTHFVGLDTPHKFYVHWQRVSNDGKWATFAGEAFGGSLAAGKREVYVWEIGKSDADAVRVTFETDYDTASSLFVPPGCGGPADCNDGNPCTTDACSAGQCSHTPISGCCTTAGQCGDGDPCTTDACKGDNTCSHTPITGCCHNAGECGDGSLCTTDTCNASNTCKHTPISGCCTKNSDCADTNPCTADSCNTGNGECSNVATVGCCAFDTECDDAKVCTQDTCDGNHVCQYPPISGCCTKADECDDANPCTTDTCVDNGCGHELVADCCKDDADCADSDPCTDDDCNLSTHRCEYAVSTTCSEGNDAGVPPDATPALPPSSNDASNRNGHVLIGGCAMVRGAPDLPWLSLALLALLAWTRRPFHLAAHTKIR